MNSKNTARWDIKNLSIIDEKGMLMMYRNGRSKCMILRWHKHMDTQTHT